MERRGVGRGSYEVKDVTLTVNDVRAYPTREMKGGTMAYRVAVCNNKGGVGKTNEAVNLAVFLVVTHGMRVRLVDLDPQADASAALGFEVNEAEEENDTILEAIQAAYVRQRLVTGTAAGVVQACRWDVPWKDSLTFIPARFDLEEVNHAAVNLDAYLRLRAAMQGADEGVDVIIYDCPPSLGVLPKMAWADSDDLLLITQPSFRSYRGLRRTLAELMYARDELRVPDLDYCGVIINGHRTNTSSHHYWTERIVREFGDEDGGRHWGTVPLRARLARLDDELVPVALMPDDTAKDRAEKDELTRHYAPIVERLRSMALSTDTVTEQ